MTPRSCHRSLGLVLLLLALLRSTSALAVGSSEAEAQALFAQSVEDYEEGRHASAELGFRSLVEQGHADSTVLFNMGNAAYRQGRFAEAVYALEWAKELEPGESAIEQNLAMARGRLIVDELADGLSPAVREAQSFVKSIPLAPLRALCLGAWCLGWLLLLWRLSGSKRAVVLTWPAIGLLLLALLLAAPVLYRMAEDHGPARGVLVASEVEVKSGPGVDYATLFNLHAGALLEQREERGRWTRVGVPHSEAGGWVPSDSLAILGEIGTLPPPAFAE